MSDSRMTTFSRALGKAPVDVVHVSGICGSPGAALIRRIHHRIQSLTLEVAYQFKK